MRSCWTKIIGSFLFILFGLGLFGCGEKKPDGLPELQPVTLHFTQDGQPCADASVHLIPQDNSPWAVGGSTDSAGAVILKTHGKYIGAPAGKYKITVSKIERENIGEPPKDMLDLAQEVKMYNLIDPIYSDPAKTTFEIEVIRGKKTSESFDLGEKIRVEIAKPEY